jgi:hypothetical protein
MLEQISTLMYANSFPAFALRGGIVQWAAYPLAYVRQSQIRFAGFAYTPPGGIRLFAVRSIFFLQLLSQPASTIASHLYLTIYQ